MGSGQFDSGTTVVTGGCKLGPDGYYTAYIANAGRIFQDFFLYFDVSMMNDSVPKNKKHHPFQHIAFISSSI